MSVVGLCRLVRDLERLDGLVTELRSRPDDVLDRYPISDAEREAVIALDAQALVDAGLNALPMRNLVALLGVPGDQIYTHQLSLRAPGA